MNQKLKILLNSRCSLARKTLRTMRKNSQVVSSTLGVSQKVLRNAYFNHHPKWDIDEDALLVAAKAVAQVVCS